MNENTTVVETTETVEVIETPEVVEKKGFVPEVKSFVRENGKKILYAGATIAIAGLAYILGTRKPHVDDVIEVYDLALVETPEESVEDNAN